MESPKEPPVATALEDSLKRLHQEIEWRILGEEVRAHRHRLESMRAAEEVMIAEEQVSPELRAKRERLLKLLRARVVGNKPPDDA